MAESHSQETRRIYARLLRYSLPHWKAFALSVLAMLVFAATNTGFAALMKPMIDGSFVAKDPTVIRLVPLLIIGLFLTRGVANFISSYCMSWVGREVILELRRAMFAKLLCLPTELARHVMLHELAHLQHLNHSRPFWALLHSLDPHTDRHHAALRAAWLHMPAWLETG